MGILVFSFLWVMQDLYHQPYQGATGEPRTRRRLGAPDFRFGSWGVDVGLRVQGFRGLGV